MSDTERIEVLEQRLAALETAMLAWLPEPRDGDAEAVDTDEEELREMEQEPR